ncbi:MAG: DUF1598 domain-containing protein [Planctomycetaceae bacterium]|nr:DUF1598 domain-containing protein [Planctomycetaceae bacterium]
MLPRDFAALRRRVVLVMAVGVVATLMMQCPVANGQLVNQAVGGVSINAEGILKAAQPDQEAALARARADQLGKVPTAMNSATPMRAVSLRRLAATLDDCVKNNKPIPDSAKYLAGLQRIQYVFVYPEQKDIVLVGPGEGWKVDGKGNVVGVVTGRPIMLLDDLLVALQTAKAAAQGGITCSIDPTTEGLSRLSQLSPSLDGSRDARLVASRMEEALGMQRISVSGVPGTSHFARVLVAADYKMKRIGMNFEPSPVRGLPSYLQMVPANFRSVQTPRFWLEPKYEAVLRDPNGMAYELRGSGVKAMTEEDFLAANGNMQHSGKAGRIAQKWADAMTEKYPQLAVAEPIFGQLQNCMDLAVVGALIVKDRLPEKAGNSLPSLLESPTVKADAFNVPKQVKSMASIVEKGRHPIISVSGGVAINSWIIADGAKTSEKLGQVRAKVVPAENGDWWWN